MEVKKEQLTPEETVFATDFIESQKKLNFILSETKNKGITPEQIESVAEHLHKQKMMDEVLQFMKKLNLSLNQVLEAVAYVDGKRLIHQVTSMMREIPELPSEKLNNRDKEFLRQVEISDKGGVFTHMTGHDVPYKGFPFFELVDRIDMAKKMTRSFLSGLYHSFKDRSKLSFIALIPSIWFMKDIFYAGVYGWYRLIERFRIKEMVYCEAVREIRRSFSLPRKEGRRMRELRPQLRDLVCMLLELDNAYRFRAQDLAEEINQTEMKSRPVKEIKRLINLAVSREKQQTIKDTWKLFRYLFYFSLVFDRDLVRLFGEVLSEIDINKVKLSIEDKHFCEKREDYTFGFQIFSEEKKVEDQLKNINVSSILNERRVTSLQI